MDIAANLLSISETVVAVALIVAEVALDIFLVGGVGFLGVAETLAGVGIDAAKNIGAAPVIGNGPGVGIARDAIREGALPVVVIVPSDIEDALIVIEHCLPHACAKITVRGPRQGNERRQRQKKCYGDDRSASHTQTPVYTETGVAGITLMDLLYGSMPNGGTG